MSLLPNLTCAFVFDAEAKRACLEAQSERKALNNANKADERDHQEANKALSNQNKADRRSKRGRRQKNRQDSGVWGDWIDGINIFHTSSNMSANRFFSDWFGGSGGGTAPPAGSSSDGGGGTQTTEAAQDNTTTAVVAVVGGVVVTALGAAALSAADVL